MRLRYITISMLFLLFKVFIKAIIHECDSNVIALLAVHDTEFELIQIDNNIVRFPVFFQEKLSCNFSMRF